MYSVEEFIRLTDWKFEEGTPEAPQRAAMGRALSFFGSEVPTWRLAEPVHDPGPWTVKIGGVTTFLCALMQAIRLTEPVYVVGLSPGSRLLNYGVTDQSRPGNWFTIPGTPAPRLAIPHDQVRPRVFVLTGPARALVSTVGDNYVDWARRRGIGERYAHGGGMQIFIWNGAARVRREASLAARRGR